MIELGPGNQNNLLNFPSDQSLRRKWFVAGSFAHPAKINLNLLKWVVEWFTLPGDTIADPMAGSGSILLAAAMGRNIIARDVEQTWVDLMQQNSARFKQDLFSTEFGNVDISQGNARVEWGFKADHLIFSPPYGCAASPNPQARRMLPYKLATTPGIKYHERWNKLLANPGPGAMGALVFHYGEHPDQIGHWRGARYWEAMKDIYTQARVSLEPDGYMVLIIKDHIFKKHRVHIADQTVELCETLGFKLHERHQRRVWPLALWQRRRKERGEPIVEEEDVLVFKQSLIKIS